MRKRTEKFYCHKCMAWTEHYIFGDMVVCEGCGDDAPLRLKRRIKKGSSVRRVEKGDSSPSPSPHLWSR